MYHWRIPAQDCPGFHTPFCSVKYTVKNNLNSSPGEYTNWICSTSPAFSWFKNVRVELDGTEVTQSSKVSDMQIVQHIMSVTVFFNLVKKNKESIKASSSKITKKEKRTQNKSVLKTCVRRVDYDLRGCMGGFLGEGGTGKG